MSNPKKPKVYKTEKSVIPRKAFQDLRPKGSDYILMKPDGTGQILINQEEYDWFVKNGVIEKSTDIKLKQFKRSELKTIPPLKNAEEVPIDTDEAIRAKDEILFGSFKPSKMEKPKFIQSTDELILSELRAIRELLEKGIPVYEVFEKGKH